MVNLSRVRKRNVELVRLGKNQQGLRTHFCLGLRSALSSTKNRRSSGTVFLGVILSAHFKDFKGNSSLTQRF